MTTITTTRQITLISALSGDTVPGRELAELEADGIRLPGLTDMPQVQEFLRDCDYGPDNPHELVYVVGVTEDEDDQAIPVGFDRITVTTQVTTPA